MGVNGKSNDEKLNDVNMGLKKEYRVGNEVRGEYSCIIEFVWMRYGLVCGCIRKNNVRFVIFGYWVFGVILIKNRGCRRKNRFIGCDS